MIVIPAPNVCAALNIFDFTDINSEVGLVFRPVCSHVKVDQGFILGC
jgi:hypothetical protein